MSNNRGIKRVGFVYAACCMTSSMSYAEEAPHKHPNFVWSITEGISKHYLSLYNDGKEEVATPNVEKLVVEGIVFNNAYCNVPMNSTVHSTLITGCYIPRLGVGFRRKLREMLMPEGLDMFPSYLRKTSYRTSNAAEVDYNCFSGKTAWDVVGGRVSK